MKGDLPEACLRMLSSLPVRTHHSAPPDGTPPAFGNRRGSGHSKPVYVDGKLFSSGSQARLKLGLQWEEFKEMLEDGRARYK